MHIQDLEFTRIGKFSTGGRVIVTDPCYKKVLKTDRLQMVIDVTPGIYHAKIGMVDGKSWGERVAELIIIHDLYKTLPTHWERAHTSCGVDSGQLGFFDLDQYPEGESTGEYGEENTFYGLACSKTIGENRMGGGCLEFGALSRTGYGDGSYPVFIARNQAGEVIGLRVVYIAAEDDEDFQEYDENEEE